MGRRVGDTKVPHGSPGVSLALRTLGDLVFAPSSTGVTGDQKAARSLAAGST